MSDLHLEVGKQYRSFEFPVTAPRLILAGDIGCLADYELYLEFLGVQCKRFDRVFLVLGNHEFYGLSRDEGLRRANALEKEPVLEGRLVLLNRRRVDLGRYPDVAIIGCTLQSRITPESRSMVEMKVQDFKRIEGWTVDHHNEEHEKDLEWLQEQIKIVRGGEDGSRKQILVVTHHAPCMEGTSRPFDATNMCSTAFSTDLLEGENNPLTDVHCWIFGHTHYTTDFMKSGVRVVSNQRGYVLSPSSDDASSPSSRNVWQHAVSLFTKPNSEDRHTFDSNKTISL